MKQVFESSIYTSTTIHFMNFCSFAVLKMLLRYSNSFFWESALNKGQETIGK